MGRRPKGVNLEILKWDFDIVGKKTESDTSVG